MPPASNSIATRQHAEVLWRVQSPLTAGQTLEGAVRDVRGYSLVNFLVLANDAVVLDVEEGNTSVGPFSMVASYAAVLDLDGRYVIREQYQPSGPFARAKISNSNPGPVSELDLSGLGLPYGGGGGSGGGAQGFQGPSGAPPGAQGSQGPTGATGATGSTGPQGNTGPQGTVGTDGSDGAQGPAGSDGANGSQGNQGTAGIQGAQGPSEAGVPAAAIYNNLYAETTLPDMTPVNPPLTYNGTVVSEIPIPSGRLVISDLYLGVGFVYWTIEVDRGLGDGFVPLATFGFTLLDLVITEKKNFKSPIVIDGGTGVKMRLQVAAAEIPASPIDVNATVRCYLLAAAPVTPGSTSVVFTLSDLATTGPTEEILNISEDGGTPALSIPVPAGTTLEISDYDVAAGGQRGMFRLQQTNDGISWFTLGALQVVGISFGVSIMASPGLAWRISGDDGSAVAVRLAITTPDGATPVAAVLSGYRLS